MQRLLIDQPDIGFTVLTRTINVPDLNTLPITAIKTDIFGVDYDLSLVFVGTHRIHTLNREYRKKDQPTDILSFPISNTSGEIVIAPEIAARKARKFNRELSAYTGYLFIHGCLHLKGMRHGRTMDSNEVRLCTAYGL